MNPAAPDDSWRPAAVLSLEARRDAPVVEPRLVRRARRRRQAFDVFDPFRLRALDDRRAQERAAEGGDSARSRRPPGKRAPRAAAVRLDRARDDRVPLLVRVEDST